MNTVSASVVGRRYRTLSDDAGNETVEEFDALVEAENSGDEVDLHLSPRTDEVETLSLSAAQAWVLARELARAAADLERQG